MKFNSKVLILSLLGLTQACSDYDLQVATELLSAAAVAQNVQPVPGWEPEYDPYYIGNQDHVSNQINDVTGSIDGGCSDELANCY